MPVTAPAQVSRAAGGTQEGGLIGGPHEQIPPAARSQTRAADESALRSLARQLWAARWAYLFLLPALLPFFVFILLPIFKGLQLSFFEARLQSREWVGLANFEALLRDEAFRQAVLNTVYFVLGVVPITVAISLTLAVIIHPLARSIQSFFRLAFYLPVVAAGVVLSMVWLYIYNPTYGLLNYLLSLVGIGRVEWLGRTETALPSLAVVVVSWTIGQPLILFLAGLAGIPQDLYDAAMIDGAGGWAKFWRVTFPLLRPTTLFVLVTQTIGVFQVFVVVLLMTRGGPVNATQTIVYQIYETAFTFFQFGYASAMGAVLLLIVGLVAIGQFRLLGQEVEY
jgi:multiple sugar transport system permease protein